MHQAQLKFCLSPSTCEVILPFQVRFDGQYIFDDVVSETREICHSFDDQEQDHCLEFILKHKLPSHTVLSSDGEIVQDVLINIHNISIEGIDLDQIVYDHSRYSHDFNGTQSIQDTKFYGSMGCNGQVIFKFSSPFYLWLLEHM